MPPSEVPDFPDDLAAWEEALAAARPGREELLASIESSRGHRDRALEFVKKRPVDHFVAFLPKTTAEWRASYLEKILRARDAFARTALTQEAIERRAYLWSHLPDGEDLTWQWLKIDLEADAAYGGWYDAIVAALLQYEELEDLLGVEGSVRESLASRGLDPDEVLRQGAEVIKGLRGQPTPPGALSLAAKQAIGTS